MEAGTITDQPVSLTLSAYEASILTGALGGYVSALGEQWEAERSAAAGIRERLIDLNLTCADCGDATMVHYADGSSRCGRCS